MKINSVLNLISCWNFNLRKREWGENQENLMKFGIRPSIQFLLLASTGLVHEKLNVVEILKETSYFIESKQKIVKWLSLKANLYHTFWLCVRSNWKGTKNEYREPLNFFLLNCVFEGRINQRDDKGRGEQFVLIQDVVN